MARRSPHIVSHDLHEVEGHTEKDVIPKKDICGTKTSIVVSKDTTYVVSFADASKKGLFSDSPFCFLSASAR